MPKTHIRVYRDASGAVKHVQENDTPIKEELSERDANGVEQLVEFSDGVIEFDDSEPKPKAREILQSLDNEMRPRAETRLSKMVMRDPDDEESAHFGAANRLARRSMADIKSNRSKQ